MIAATLSVLISVVTIATALALVDFWLRASSAYALLKRQSDLVKAGFVPQVEARVVRLRPAAPRGSSAATRPFATRLPRRASLPARLRGAA
ncbi:hypothetical protein [Erythrobacter rubeus]|uniref:Uncharacterized protein n=1 Tax=Erythrobacter rubeus TaxID=2760803 RepID=A0ABR8KUU5_9SPHN|nr:hypothetical protein [Erythrobacter rubeus]MBD2842194.1 hypothetical protein [Erythrobacter rubeus]